MNTIIELKNIYHNYNEKEVLKGISLSVKKGEIIGLLGPSGAGKTTLVNILTGQLSQTSGIGRVLGDDTKHITKQTKTQIGIMMDSFVLYQRLTVYYNMQLFAEIYKVDKKKIKETLEKVGLYEARKTTVSNLSKGMRNRLNMARAILQDSSLLFLDEPTSGLDPATTDFIHELLLEMKHKGITIFLTTHNMYEASKLCDNIALLNQGEIIEYGNPEEICRKYNQQAQFTIVLQNDETLVLPNAPESGEKIGHLIKNQNIKSIHSSEPTLEDVFLKLTGRKLDK
ncbi:MAG: ABC transporter ATP-binding protein [Eubacterium sp.]|nr:ABC transporter ATP-binding protein [Eubacterium sp.]